MHAALFLLPAYGENTAAVFDVSQEHTIVGDYPGHSDLPCHDSMREDVVEIFSLVNEVVAWMSRQYRTGFVER